MSHAPIAPPPRQLVLEVASVCNLSCPQCWTGLNWAKRSRAFPHRDLWRKVAIEAKDFVKHTYLHLWGEPTLNRELPEMIKLFKEFSTIDIATHGLNITPEIAEAICECDTISVSIDGITQEVYEKYRVGGRLEDAMRGLRMLTRRRRDINWTFVVMKDNEHQVDAAALIAREMDVNFGPKPPIFWDRSAMNQQMPTDEKYRRYRWDGTEWKLKADPLRCREFWETIYVLPNGDVVTCCYDGKAEWVMGNVRERSLMEVWNDTPYQEMRASHLAKKLNALCATQCQLPPNESEI